VHPDTYRKQLWPKDIAGRGSKKRPIYRVKGKNESEDIVCANKYYKRDEKDIRQCCSSLMQLIGKRTRSYIKIIHVHIRAAQSPLPVASKLADGLRSMEMTVQPVSPMK